MRKKTVRDIDLANKRVLVRVDFNVPLKEGRVTDDSRIKAALPTIQYLREQNCRVILMSHLGRPKNGPDPAFALDPVAMRLAELLRAPVRKLDELTGPGVEAAVSAMQPGDVLLLENSRFDPREKKNDPELTGELAKLGDVYVNDAFSAAHRAHVTTAGLASRYRRSPASVWRRKWTRSRASCPGPSARSWWFLEAPRSPTRLRLSTASSISRDTLLIGGAMSPTFLKARGHGGGKQGRDEGLELPPKR